MSWKNHFRILLVDEREDILRTLTGRFLRMGFKDISLAKNGREAVELIERIVPDLTMINMTMQMKEGHQSLKNIRKLGFDCLIVTLNENASGSDRENAVMELRANILTKRQNDDFEMQLFTILENKGYILSTQQE